MSCVIQSVVDTRFTDITVQLAGPVKGSQFATRLEELKLAACQATEHLVNVLYFTLVDEGTKIGHNVYQFEDGGEVQSLAYKTGEGKDATHGVIIPGTTKKFDFGVAKRRETIYVVQGLVRAKGMNVGVFNNRDGQVEFNRVVIFEPGETILLECENPAAYNCIYE